MTTRPTDQEFLANLNALDPSRASTYASWIEVGQIIHSFFGHSDVGLDIWDEWSQQDPKYKENKPNQMRSHWESFQGGSGLTYKTIFKYARDDGYAGYRPPTADPTVARSASDDILTPTLIRAGDGQKNGDTSDDSRPTPGSSNSTVLSKERKIEHKGRSKSKYYWQSEQEAIDAYKELPPVAGEGQDDTLQWLVTEYAIDPNDIPMTWRVLDHPLMGTGIVYPGHTPTGNQLYYKFKSTSRDNKGKRSTAFLYAPDPGKRKDHGAFIIDIPDAPLVVVGGEEKAAAAASAGFAALGSLVGEKCLSDGWCRWIAERRPPSVILANDHDEDGRKANHESAQKLAKSGYPRLRIHQIQWDETLPPAHDLNDELKAGRDITKLLTTAPRVFQGMTILSVIDILKMQFPADDSILGDHALSLGQLACFVGEGGVGKSRLALQLAICCIEGWDFLGLPTNAVGKKFLMFQVENKDQRVQDDLQGMLSGHNNQVIKRVSDHLHVLSTRRLEDRWVTLEDDANFYKLRSEVEAFEPDVVVFDPLLDFFAGDNENDNMQMHNTMRKITQVAQAVNQDAIPLILHHGKIGKAAIRGGAGYDAKAYARGAKALNAAARSQINLLPGSPDPADGLMCIFHAKCNDGPLFSRRAARLDPYRRWYEIICDFDWNGWEQGIQDGAKNTRKQLDTDLIKIHVNQLADANGWAKQGVIVEAVKGSSGVSNRTVRRRLDEMVEAGSLDMETEGEGPGRRIKFRLPLEQ